MNTSNGLLVPQNFTASLFFRRSSLTAFQTDLLGKGILVRGDFTRMAGQLAKIEGRFILSINGVSEIREIFSVFTLKKAATTHCTGKVAGHVQELLPVPIHSPYRPRQEASE